MSLLNKKLSTKLIISMTNLDQKNSGMLYFTGFLNFQMYFVVHRGVDFYGYTLVALSNVF